MDSLSKNLIDPRIRRLSYSGRTTLHRCPRKYQLQKIAKIPRELEDNVTLEFGHVVGLGIQCILENKSINDTVLEMFLNWSSVDLFAEEEKSKKSFFTAVFAVQKFVLIRETALADYELAYFNSKPAVELSFRITLMRGFTYRGYVDVVLRHKVTGKFLVLEVKTTGMTYISEENYKNSSQALGYSLILDAIAPNESEYEVWYLVYLTKSQTYEILPFKKHYSDRAFWIKELVMDVERIEYYEEQGRYPSYGESCFDFFRQCDFYSNCQMSTQFLEIPYDPNILEMQDNGEYLLELNLIDLITSQLDREEL